MIEKYKKEILEKLNTKLSSKDNKPHLEILEKLKGSVVNSDVSGLVGSMFSVFEELLDTKHTDDFEIGDDEPYRVHGNGEYVLVMHDNDTINDMAVESMLEEMLGMSKKKASQAMKHIRSNGDAIIAIGSEEELSIILDSITMYMGDVTCCFEIMTLSDYDFGDTGIDNSVDKFVKLKNSKPKDHVLIFLEGGAGEKGSEDGYEDMTILLDRVVGYNSELKSRQHTEIIYNESDVSVFYGSKDEVEAMQDKVVRYMDLMGFTDFEDKCKIQKVKREDPKPLRFLDSGLIATVKHGNAVKLVTSKAMCDEHYNKSMGNHIGYKHLVGNMLGVGYDLSVLYVTGYISNTDTYIVTNPNNGKTVYGHSGEFLFLPNDGS